MARKEKRGKSEVQKFDDLEDKRIFFSKTKSIFDNFLIAKILIAKIKIVATSCHNGKDKLSQ